MRTDSIPVSQGSSPAWKFTVSEGYAVYPGFHEWVGDDLQHKTRKLDVARQHKGGDVYRISPGQLNIPEGAICEFRAGIEAGGKLVAKEAFIYDPSASEDPLYQTHGTTQHAHMDYEGLVPDS